MAKKEGERLDSQLSESVGDNVASATAGQDLAGASLSLDEADLLLKIYRALLTDEDFATGLQCALEIIGRYAGWRLISAWLPTEDEAAEVRSAGNGGSGGTRFADALSPAG